MESSETIANKLLEHIANSEQYDVDSLDVDIEEINDKHNIETSYSFRIYDNSNRNGIPAKKVWVIKVECVENSTIND